MMADFAVQQHGILRNKKEKEHLYRAAPRMSVCGELFSVKGIIMIIFLKWLRLINVDM